MMKVTLFFAAFFLSMTAHAAIEPKVDQVEVGTLNLRLSVGYGGIENPLKRRESLETYILPEFSYYGERFYAENFVLGYSLWEQENWALDLFGYFNDDGYFFELDGIEKITVATILGRRPNITPIDGEVELEAVDRSLSYMGGLNFMYNTPWFLTHTTLAHDVTGVHDGEEASFAMSRHFGWHQLSFGFQAGIKYKSTDINDYYYQIRREEFPLRGTIPNIGSTQTKWFELNSRYRLSESWSARLTLKKHWLDNKLKNSILVEDLDYLSGFVGLSYTY